MASLSDFGFDRSGYTAGYAGYLDSNKRHEEEQESKLRKMGVLAQLQEKAQAQQEEAQLKGVLSQSGGDPAKAVQALIQAGTPKSLALAAQLKGMLPKPAEDRVIGGALVSPKGEVIYQDREPAAARVEAARVKQEDKVEADRVRAADRVTDRADQQQGRMDLAQFMVANRPARAEPQVQPLVSIIGPDGKPRLVERKDAVGATPAGAGSKAEATAIGKTGVDTDVMNLKSALDSLNTGGGITSTDKGVLPNVARWASTTGPGQLLGTMGGTHNQKNRDVILQARPLLLRSIMQATGMSAKQLDSNAELKLWLSTATDPTKGYEANVEALNSIASKYGSGGFMEGGQQASGPIKPSRRLDDLPTGMDPKVWGAMTPEQKKLFK